MGLFENKRDRFLKEIEKAKKKKVLEVVKAKKKDVDVNKKISEKEELAQLKFDLMRLKKKPMTNSQILAKKQLVIDIKDAVKKYGFGSLKGAGKIAEFFAQDFEEEVKRNIIVSKNNKTKKFDVKLWEGKKLIDQRSFNKKSLAEAFASKQRRSL